MAAWLLVEAWMCLLEEPYILPPPFLACKHGKSTQQAFHTWHVDHILISIFATMPTCQNVTLESMDDI